jgi:hypothetical protein
MSYVNDGIYQRNIVRSDSKSCDVIKSEEMTTHMRLTYYKLPYTIIANLRYGEYWHYSLLILMDPQLRMLSLNKGLDK